MFHRSPKPWSTATGAIDPRYLSSCLTWDMPHDRRVKGTDPGTRSTAVEVAPFVELDGQRNGWNGPSTLCGPVGCLHRSGPGRSPDAEEPTAPRTPPPASPPSRMMRRGRSAVLRRRGTAPSTTPAPGAAGSRGPTPGESPYSCDPIRWCPARPVVRHRPRRRPTGLVTGRPRDRPGHPRPIREGATRCPFAELSRPIG